MTAFDRLKTLCDEQGISVNKLEEKLGLGKNTLYSWKKNTPKGSNLIKVAEFFDTSTDYLLGLTDRKRYYDLTEKDEKGIQKQLEEMINGLNSKDGYAAFDGQILDDMDEEDKELLISALENSLKVAKRVAKQKFTPKKYR
ncbi:helix-turn-helix domain-containing protein [Cytobacillus horneckiae]|uniref:helix-turn-helix domain-containing protein n=1 Tax=Cytobacillus horneckiae TaxID=549687 RepID=UPI00203C6897|nr:helix-turn-helix transcriptional regulator [Cytobacillus horneckiae]MCM3179712.1 helix-turn-helix domain-containing protein [Cytobacillus horneckiae]